jgi:hypothetical protein
MLTGILGKAWFVAGDLQPLVWAAGDNLVWAAGDDLRWG